MTRVFEFIDTLDISAGVLSLIHGEKETVDILLEHADINAMSFSVPFL